MSDLVFLREYEGARLSVDKVSGRFHGHLGAQTVVRPNLAEVEEWVRRIKKPVTALWFPTGHTVATVLPEPIELVLVGGSEAGAWLTAEGQELRRAAGKVVRHNETRFANAQLELTVRRARVEDILREWQRWLDSMPSLTRGDTGWDEA